jgi:hypothetical protein
VEVEMKKFICSAVAWALLLSVHSFAGSAYTSERLPKWATFCAGQLPRLSAAPVQVTGVHGELLYGFDGGALSHSGPITASVVLETTANAYFYSELSDIWQVYYECHKVTGDMKLFKESHALSCTDLPVESLTSPDLLYKDCSAE